MKSVLFADAVGGNGVFSLQRSRDGIDGRAIEIDDRVEKTAGPDKGVQGFAVFVSCPEIGAAASRCERRADHLDGGRRQAKRPNAGRESLFELLQRRPAMGPEIVDAFEPDDRGDAGKAQDIPAEALQSSRAARVRLSGAIDFGFQDPVAGDAGVHHGNLVSEALMQPARQHVGPAVLAVQACAHAVGQRVAEGRHEHGSGAGPHVEGVEKKRRRRAEGKSRLVLARADRPRMRRRQIGGRQRLGVPGHGAALARDMKADRKFAPQKARGVIFRHKRQGRRVAPGVLSGRDLDPVLAAERDGTV